MRGHAPAGADTLAGQVGGVALAVFVVLVLAALLWFVWPTLVGRKA